MVRTQLRRGRGGGTGEGDIDDYADVYLNAVVGATSNPLMPDPDAVDEEFAAGANRALQDAVELLRRLVPSHQSAAAIVVHGDWSSVRKFFSLSPKYAAWSTYRTRPSAWGAIGGCSTSGGRSG
ncbi:hypothetical protein SAMN05660209_01015 [Geodermatophilus africanus]|uniref:Uncharacterized protein n=1 Tax=Geodermatophilus africanus TaxID=1137993 RepID=A0A1H3DJ86_9ACTN|nr:hypothetical protein [Geodermatophilus africanus]SDX66475.1 hypothetical protein SAMN05660209_01015 [Geodermatophilus africanus]